MGKISERIIRFTQESDEEGRTVLRPLTEDDRKAMETGLENPAGLKIGVTLDEAQECPIESDLPYGLSICRIAAEQEEKKRAARILLRQEWLSGKEELALNLLKVLDDS